MPESAWTTCTNVRREEEETRIGNKGESASTRKIIATPSRSARIEWGSKSLIDMSEKRIFYLEKKLNKNTFHPTDTSASISEYRYK